jgi:hypothetical protein
MNLCLARVVICAAILIEACPALTANPQDSRGTASIKIRVEDATGGRVPGAQIKIVLPPFGLVATQTTDSTGTVSVHLSPGRYDVNVTSPGFRKATRHMDVQQGMEQTIEIVLDVGGSFDPVVTEQLLTTERAPAGDLIIPCSRTDLTATLLPTDPVYNDAAELSRKLEGLGLSVRCTLASKMRRVFAGQKGAALYRTNAGDFEALFLPQSETFDGLDIVEQQREDQYLYSFRGTPRSKVHMDGSKPSYFIVKRNVLFYVRGDDRLAAILQSKISN